MVYTAAEYEEINRAGAWVPPVTKKANSMSLKQVLVDSIWFNIDSIVLEQ